MDSIIPDLKELLNDEFWKAVVRRVLDFHPRASRKAVGQLEKGLSASGFVVDGFNRAPLKAPPGRLLKTIQDGIDSLDVKAAVMGVWIESQAELMTKGKDYLSQFPQRESSTEGQDILKVARSFQETHPEVTLEDAALMFTVLLNTTEEVELQSPTRNTSSSETGKAPVDRSKILLDRERERNRTLREENRKLLDKLEESERQERGLTKNLRDVNRQIKEQKESEDQRIASRVQEEKRKLMLDFSSTAERDVCEHAGDEFESALSFASGAIERQAAKNIRWGTIHSVREKFRRVSESLTELRKLKNDSVLVVPEVDVAIRKLEGLREKMLRDDSLSNVLMDLAGKPIVFDLSGIRNLDTAKSSLPMLEQVSMLTPELLGMGLLTDSVCADIREAVQEKIRQIILKETSFIPVNPSESFFDDSYRSGRLKGKDLVIDGNNVLLTNLLPEGEKKIPNFSAKREGFNANVARASHGFRHVYIVYDGDRSVENTKGNVSVVFTDKQKLGISADDKIAELIDGMPKDTAILATLDSMLIQRCPKAYKFLDPRDCFGFFMAGKPAHS